MQPERIKIAEGTTLTLRRARVGSHPMDRERALSALRAAKDDATTMHRHRLLMPQAATAMNDEDVLGSIATSVAHGQWCCISGRRRARRTKNDSSTGWRRI